RQQGDGGGVFGDSQFTSTLSVNFHFPKIPRRTKKKARRFAPAGFCIDSGMISPSWPAGISPAG
ncbi:hypothetical protein ACSZM6_19090, partial [Aeromonas caviae]|uniref:hypothetical protein n=1 Tax=Aeromonas caviae TaxID=648 RepID=UPI003EC80075